MTTHDLQSSRTGVSPLAFPFATGLAPCVAAGHAGAEASPDDAGGK